MRFVSSPNLPAARVKLCALAAGQATYIRALRRLGVAVVPVQAHPALNGAVARHADLSLHHLGGNRALVANGCETLAASLRGHGFSVRVAGEPLRGEYPGDIPLCGMALGGKLYCKPSHTAAELLAAYSRIVPVRQGYVRCATCVVDEHSAITADKGVAAALGREGCAVLLIRPGYIRLSGYDYGFIGGCAGLLDSDLLAFTGALATHPDGEAILRFCGERGVRAVALAAGPLVDIGGILPLLED